MRRTLRRRATAIWLAVLVAGLAACSASGSSTSVAGEAGAAEVPAQAQADAGNRGGNVADAAANAAGRQVIATGSVQVTVGDPRAAADAVVTLVEGESGRVDARKEAAAKETRQLAPT